MDRENTHHRRFNLKSSFLNGESFYSYMAILPVIIILIVFMAIPIMNVVYHSLTLWNGLTATFIGFQNYISMFTDSTFWYIIVNNLLFLISVPLTVIVSLIVSVLIYEEVPGWRFFRSLFFMPYVLSAVVVGFLFRSIFAYSGPLNELLTNIGLGNFAIDWLSSRYTAIFVIVLAVVWTQLGYGMLVYLTGLSSVQPSVFEASRIDGANWFQRLVFVTIPMLVRTTEFLIILNTIFAFTSLFDYIFTISRGGPGYDTTPINYWIYRKAFEANEMGYACALALVLFLFLFLVAIIQRRIVNRLDDWGD